MKEKQRSAGTVGPRLKAPLVTKGYFQVEGVEFSNTFAPLVEFTSIRIMLSLKVSFDVYLHKMNVAIATLYSRL